MFDKIILDTFRGIGFNTHMWPDKIEEKIFFWIGHGEDYKKMDSVSDEAVHEFIAYYENQIKVAKDYLLNGKNPNTHEWGAVHNYET